MGRELVISARLGITILKKCGGQQSNISGWELSREPCWLAGTDIHVKLFHPTKNSVATCAPVEGSSCSFIAANMGEAAGKRDDC